MTAIVHPVNAVSGQPEYDGRMLRQLQSPLMGAAPENRPLGARSGVRAGTPASTISLDGFDWTLGVHSGVIDKHASTLAGGYTYAITEPETGTISAAHATNPRIDIITVRVNDPAESDGSTVPELVVSYKAGNAASSPVVPTPDSTREMIVARFDVPASGGGNPTATWVAPYIASVGTPIVVRNNTERDALAASVDVSAENPLYVHNAAETAGAQLQRTIDGTTWLTVWASNAALETYTPVFVGTAASPNLGSGGNFTHEGRHWMMPGNMVRFQIRLRFGSTGVSEGSGFYEFGLPVTANPSFHSLSSIPGVGDSIGTAVMFDSSASAFRQGAVFLRSGNLARVTLNEGQVGNITPWTWATADAINISGEYKAA